MEELQFKSFPKMARLSRQIQITEKIDGTNAQILITTNDNINHPAVIATKKGEMGENLVMLAGSRNKWITPKDDNYGFAQWVKDNAEDLFNLGAGRHFGEWWGQGIQRKYGMNEKVFSLFNAIKWCEHEKEPKKILTADPRIEKMQTKAPACCRVVPVLWEGDFDSNAINYVLKSLEIHGSFAAPGFMKPEGVIIYHIAGNVGFKKTIEGDSSPKSV